VEKLLSSNDEVWELLAPPDPPELADPDHPPDELELELLAALAAAPALLKVTVESAVADVAALVVDESDALVEVADTGFKIVMLDELELPVSALTNIIFPP
jgi:hypothetical protein